MHEHFIGYSGLHPPTRHQKLRRFAPRAGATFSLHFITGKRLLWRARCVQFVNHTEDYNARAKTGGARLSLEPWDR